jgi:hypothetical protein
MSNQTGGANGETVRVLWVDFLGNEFPGERGRGTRL